MFNEQKAQNVVEFIQYLHLTGDFYGQPFVLQDWQKEVLESVYGTVKKNGYRQYKYAYLEIPKKNGKTELAAAVSLYHLVCDGPGGRIYYCAADKNQASYVYEAAVAMIEQEPELDYEQGGILKVIDSKKRIVNTQTKTFVQLLSADVKNKHGANPTVVVFDELHAQPNRKLWDVMTFGAGAARKEPLWWVITTAGDDPDQKSIGWEKHQYAQEVLSGEIDDPTWYAKIYGASEDDDIWDEATWYKANPSLGVTIDIETVREEALTAKNSESTEKLFKWLRLNVWVQLKKTGWLPITLWDKTEGKWILNELHGKRCYVGLDLAVRGDLSAATYLFPPQEGFEDWRFYFDAWIPIGKFEQRIKTNENYENWKKHKFINVTKGDVVDYRIIKAHIEDIYDIYDVQYFCADQWHLEILRQQFGSEIQSKFVEIPQTIAGMGPGMSELERLILMEEENIRFITHAFNPLGRWTFGNVVVHDDGNHNVKPMKNKSYDSIDPIVALCNAMAGAIKCEKLKKINRAYDNHGIRVV